MSPAKAGAHSRPTSSEEVGDDTNSGAGRASGQPFFRARKVPPRPLRIVSDSFRCSRMMNKCQTGASEPSDDEIASDRPTSLRRSHRRLPHWPIQERTPSQQRSRWPHKLGQPTDCTHRIDRVERLPHQGCELCPSIHRRSQDERCTRQLGMELERARYTAVHHYLRILLLRRIRPRRRCVPHPRRIQPRRWCVPLLFQAPKAD